MPFVYSMSNPSYLVLLLIFENKNSNGAVRDIFAMIRGFFAAKLLSLFLNQKSKLMYWQFNTKVDIFAMIWVFFFLSFFQKLCISNLTWRWTWLNLRCTLADCETLYRMEGVGADGAAAAPVNQWVTDVSRVYQYYLDKSTPHTTYRWIGTLVLIVIFALRVYYVQGFYIISYGLGIYLLNLLIGFLSPLVDPEMEQSDGPLLPTKGSDEFKPFIRRLPEFKFWLVFI